jgi:ketosteroid isomerase-like protein
VDADAPGPADPVDPLQRLLDRAAITEVIHEYCRTLDEMDLDGLSALFTTDCYVDYGPEIHSSGAAQLKADLGRMWRWARTSHHGSGVQIRFTAPDTATATSYVLAWHERPDGSTATMMGQYHDEFVRQADGWRIARRRQVLTGNDAGFTVAINRFQRRPDQRPT